MVSVTLPALTTENLRPFRVYFTLWQATSGWVWGRVEGESALDEQSPPFFSSNREQLTLTDKHTHIQLTLGDYLVQYFSSLELH